MSKFKQCTIDFLVKHGTDLMLCISALCVFLAGGWIESGFAGMPVILAFLIFGIVYGMLAIRMKNKEKNKGGADHE